MDNGEVSGAFEVTNGVKRGCVLVPTLFSNIFSVILMDAYRDECPGIRLSHRTNGHLLNQRRVGMQRSMDLFSANLENFGLIMNTEKMVAMHQPLPNAAYIAFQINVNGDQLKVVDNFMYLGSTLSLTTKIYDKVARRVFKACQTFSRL
nr:unnamed protein product [Spirometra erinaceieuropaei]